MSENQEPALDELLRFLQEERGFDFTGYKRPSLTRRILRRIHEVRAEGFAGYRGYLEAHPEEFAHLFNSILINVTGFFRDPPAWATLERQVLPRILTGKDPGGPVRIWSAGCAAGQEAYSAAMLFAEALGGDAFRARVKIYATDIDMEALAHARSGSYSVREVEDLPAALRERYFDQIDNRFVFKTDLRRCVIFGRHDLVQDAPISRLDLVICRNTLMYLNSATQAKVMARLHFALNGHGGTPGFLFLGRAEMLLAQSSLFVPVDLKGRIFEKLPRAGERPRVVGAPAASATLNDNGARMNGNQRLRDLALDDPQVARLLVDANGALVHASHKARALFGLSAKDLGRPLQDLEVSYRPVDLRSLMQQAYAERRTVSLKAVERRFNDGEKQYFEVHVQPLYEEPQAALGVSVSFIDVTRMVRIQQELDRSHEEIQTTNEELQSANEELETTNEELQSSNEELETTNEELQSTNEELETMNEELQSTNEELQTVNEELRQRTEEMNQINSFLSSVLAGLRAGAVVLDANYNVLVWNARAEDLWGLRAEEVHHVSFLGLDIGLPVGELRPIIRACLSGESEAREVTLDAINRRGKSIRCRVTCTPLVSEKKKREGVILMMDEVE